MVVRDKLDHFLFFSRITVIVNISANIENEQTITR